jgi:hypothetical protein
MRRYLSVLVVMVLLLCMAASAHAQTSEVQKLRDQVQQLQDQLQKVLSRLQQLESKPAPPPGPAAPAPKASWADKLLVNGYFHARYEARESGLDDFTIRRLYLNVIDKPNDRTTAVITVARYGAGDPNLLLDSCWVNYQLTPRYSVTFGQILNNFCWDDTESSSQRLAFDRYVSAEGMSRAGLRGLYFKAPVDRGIAFTRNQDGDWPTAIFSIVNGSFNVSDLDDNKTVALDLKWTRPWGQFGASTLYGKYTGMEQQGTPTLLGANATTLRTATGVYFHTNPAPWGFQGEYMGGALLGHRMNGWYGQVAHKLGRGIKYVRYEEFDPQTDVANDTFTSWRLGYEYKVDKNNEITLEWQDAVRLGTQWGQLGVQWQLGF